MPIELKDWLMSKFMEWERGTGKRQSYSAFARYLGVKQSTLSQWMNGNNPPSIDAVKILAEKLSPEIYDVMGLSPPDPRWRVIRAQFSTADETEKDELLRMIEDYLNKHARREK